MSGFDPLLAVDQKVASALREFIADTRTAMKDGAGSLRNTPAILEEFKTRFKTSDVIASATSQIDTLLGELPKPTGAGKTRKRSKKSQKATRRRR